MLLRCSNADVPLPSAHYVATTHSVSIRRVASISEHRINTPVKLVARLLACSALFLAGCGFAHDTAVGSYRVVTAPIRLFHHSTPDPVPPGTTVTTTHTEVRASRRSLPQPSPVTALSQHRTTRYVASASPSPSPHAKPKQATSAVAPAPTPKAKSPAAAQSAAPEQSFPTAKPVPDKPGYVFSPSEPGKYVDVSGFAPGSKVKDPYSGKIFLVP